MEQQKIYIAFYDKIEGYPDYQEHTVNSVDNEGIIELEDSSVIYPDELDVTQDEGDYIVCCSYNKDTALYNVAKMAYEFFSRCIADISRDFNI